MSDYSDLDPEFDIVELEPRSAPSPDGQIVILAGSRFGSGGGSGASGAHFHHVSGGGSGGSGAHFHHGSGGGSGAHFHRGSGGGSGT